MTDDRNILILFGMVSDDPMLGDCLLIQHGKNKGKVIQVRKIVTVPDKFNEGHDIKLVISTCGISVPAGACTYFKLKQNGKIKQAS